MLNVYDLQRRKTAVLQNAYNITEVQELNNIYSLTFTLPDTDDKNKYCLPFHYVRYGDDGQMYRIAQTSHADNDTGSITYTCEHVIATLIDTIMFGSYTYGNGIKTRDVITWLLSKQNTRNWVLDQCDYDLEFEYGWEQENLLNALYAIPKEFASPYKWTFDTSGYPWKISLKRIDDTVHPEYYIRAKRNLLSSGTESNNADICTRLYPLGYGEGVNQLTIKDVNNGIPYLQAPQSVVDQYGIIEKVLVDRKFENAETLKAYAQTVLDSMITPSMTRSFDVVDLHEITGTDIDYAEVGKICKLTGDGTIAYITRTQRVLDKEGDLQIDLSTKTTDVASTIADLAERVRIEAVYAQGATQLYQHSKDANATPQKGAVISLYFPQEMKQINKVLLRMQLKRFRAYSQSTASGGGSTQTSSGGSASGSTSQATGSGGFSATSSATSGAVWSDIGQSADNYVKAVGQNYGSQNDTSSPIKKAPSYTITGIPNDPTYSTHKHYLYEPYPHYHTFNPVVYVYKPDFKHTHNVSISLSGSQTSHTHTFNIGSHTHSVTIPAHTHAIETGIFESGSPSSCDIYIGGTKKATVNATSYNDDITQWLLDSNGTIPRGRWIDMEIRPNDKAYVVTSVFVQGFVQSRGGGNY